jgi:TolB-like protein/DNA-binding winged helix-turn-helix (wHTH) protein/Tfp pilus assembly protein PilF
LRKLIFFLLISYGAISVTDRRFFEFGPFRLSPTGRVLFRGDQAVPLPPKAADTLLLLVLNAGDVVEKGDLLRKVWPDACVEEGSLARIIFVLRKALEDGSDGREYIATIPKRGYRFAVPVVLVEGDPQVLGSNGPTRDTGRYMIRAIALALAITALLLVSYFSAKRYSRRSDSRTGLRMIAVLPFQNLTGDPAQEFVVDGLTEEMITQLGALNHQQLGVIARTSAMTYKGSAKPVYQIGHELGVDYVLEGSVRRWGDRVRISAQLIQTRDQTHLWAQSYESDAGDVLKLQSDVAQAVAREISLTLTPEARVRVAGAAHVDPQVHELCLRGRYEWNKRTEAGLNQAISYFRQAINRDPSYAPAYAGLADTYAVLPYYSEGSPNDTFPKAQAAAERALQLDETLAEANTTLGLVEGSHLHLVAAERQYQRALELNPNYATAHHWYSFCLWTMNRQKDALEELKRARRLDPLSLIIYTDEARTLSAIHQPDDAISLLKAAIDLDPNFAEAHRSLAVAYVQKGKVAHALAEARRGVELDPNDAELATLGYVYGLAGKTEQARTILANLTRTSRRLAVAPIYLSFIYIGLDQHDEALKCLERAYQEHSLLNAGGPEPILDPLRSDPRFQDLLRRNTENLESKKDAPKS